MSYREAKPGTFGCAEWLDLLSTDPSWVSATTHKQVIERAEKAEERVAELESDNTRLRAALVRALRYVEAYEPLSHNVEADRLDTLRAAQGLLLPNAKDETHA